MIKNRDLTAEETPTVIATVVVVDNTVHFQQGDEELYLSYLSQVETLQQNYINSLKTIINSL